MLAALDWESVRSVLDLGLGAIALALYARQGKILQRLVEAVTGHEGRIVKLERNRKGRR